MKKDDGIVGTVVTAHFNWAIKNRQKDIFIFIMIINLVIVSAKTLIFKPQFPMYVCVLVISVSQFFACSTTYGSADEPMYTLCRFLRILQMVRQTPPGQLGRKHLKNYEMLMHY